MAETTKTTVDEILTPSAGDADKADAVASKSDKKEVTKPAKKETVAHKDSKVAQAEASSNTSKEAADVKTKPVASTTSVDSKHPPDMKAGTKIGVLTCVRLYSTSFTSIYHQTVTGEIYIYAEGVVNDRIRVTNSADKVGQSCGCIGWVPVDAIAKFIK